MAAKTMVSALGKKLGANLAKAVDAHKNDETKVSAGGDLPEVELGVAQLVECKIGIYKEGDNKGEFFCYMAGTVVSPKKVQLADGSWASIEGLRTQFGPEPLCDTKTAKGEIRDLDSHIAKVLNEFRKLGINTADIGADDIEATCAALKEAMPYFKFRTWKGKPSKEYPNPRINHDWRGLTDYTPDGDDGVQDNSASNGQVHDDSSGDDQTDQATSDVPFGDDLDDLVAEAGSDDVNTQAAAHEALTTRAIAAGYDQTAIDGSESWEQVAEWIRAGESDESTNGSTDDAVDYGALGLAAENGDQEAADKLDELRQAAGVSDEDFNSLTWTALAETLTELEAGGGDAASVPEVGQIWGYKGDVMDPKLKKMVKAKSASDHLVKSVVGDKVTLQNITTNKLVMDPKTKKALLIDFSELEPS